MIDVMFKIWRIGVGLILIYASALKVLSPEASYELFTSFGASSRQSNIAVIGAIFTEAFLGALLLMIRSKWVVLPTVSVFAVFSGVLTTLLVSDSEVSCGCLVASTAKSSDADYIIGIIRNGVIILTGCFLLIRLPART